MKLENREKEMPMSVIEDSRKLLQDFLAPELRAITVRLDALEKRFEAADHKVDEVDQRAEKRSSELSRKIDDLGSRMDRKIDDVDRRAEKRHDAVMFALGSLVGMNEIRLRLTRLETKDATHQ